MEKGLSNAGPILFVAVLVGILVFFYWFLTHGGAAH